MTKKHFIALAAEIAAEQDAAKREFACNVVIRVASLDNAAFDADRFKKACNVGQPAAKASKKG